MEYLPSGRRPPNMMASMGTPRGLSQFGSRTEAGKFAIGVQKREFGWEDGVMLLRVQSRPKEISKIKFIFRYKFIFTYKIVL